MFFLVGWVVWIRLGVQSSIHVALVFDWIIMGQFDYRHTCEILVRNLM